METVQKKSTEKTLKEAVHRQSQKAGTVDPSHIAYASGFLLACTTTGHDYEATLRLADQIDDPEITHAQLRTAIEVIIRESKD